MSEKRSIPTMFGACSLLVIFGVLCLVVFSLLSLSTSGAGNRLSRITAEQVDAHYAAEARAEEILAMLREGKLPDEVSQNGDVYSYSCPISDVMELLVEVQLEADGEYRILKWQSARTAPWQPNHEIELWDPNMQ